MGERVQSRLFRYMVHETIGRVYTAIDVQWLKPVDVWAAARAHDTKPGGVEVIDGLVGLALNFVDRPVRNFSPARMSPPDSSLPRDDPVPPLFSSGSPNGRF
jgi:hypothetical protein